VPVRQATQVTDAMSTCGLAVKILPAAVNQMVSRGNYSPDRGDGAVEGVRRDHAGETADHRSGPSRQ
jgi:hypothetical protein